VKLLTDLYIFKHIPIGTKPKKILDQLEYFGIIRPLMLNRLIEIRNSVEHEYVSPPELDRCKELVEFVWYFLRSTDVLANRVVNAIEIQSPDENDDYFCLELRTGPSNDWKYEIGGRIRSPFVAPENKGSHFRVELTKKKTWREKAEEMCKCSINPIQEKEIRRHPDDLSFVGAVTGPGDKIRILTERYFSAL
jgi:hypothetical protein